MRKYNVEYKKIFVPGHHVPKDRLVREWVFWIRIFKCIVFYYKYVFCLHVEWLVAKNVKFSLFYTRTTFHFTNNCQNKPPFYAVFCFTPLLRPTVSILNIFDTRICINSHNTMYQIVFKAVSLIAFMLETQLVYKMDEIITSYNNISENYV